MIGVWVSCLAAQAGSWVLSERESDDVREQLEARRPPMARAQGRLVVLRDFLQSGIQIERQLDGDELRLTWRGFETLRFPAEGGKIRVRLPADDACGQTRMIARAEHEGERLVVTRRLCGVEIVETFLPPERDRLVVVVKVDSDVLSPSLAFRRVYRPAPTTPL